MVFRLFAFALGDLTSSVLLLFPRLRSESGTEDGFGVSLIAFAIFRSSSSLLALSTFLRDLSRRFATNVVWGLLGGSGGFPPVVARVREVVSSALRVAEFRVYQK